MDYSFTAFILLLPLLSFLVLGLAGMKMSHKTAGLIGTTSLGLVTVLSYFTAFSYFSAPRLADGTFATIVPYNFTWLPLDKLHFDIGILLDPISVMMLIVISTVSLMVHIYSFGYMHGEKGFQRYYAFLSLFTMSMLGLVLATNIFQMYLFWELVGVSSYLLIGFYYPLHTAVAASKKAFIVTRFADMFFLIGILIFGYYTESFSFSFTGSEIVMGAGTEPFLGVNAAKALTAGAFILPTALTLMFIGGAGKSAMFPLHIWLPDAMEGPTPVSALIHAATMVVAGVFQVARMFPLWIQYAPQAMSIIVWVGVFTAFYAAAVACAQSDIKRVLAFSTISQIAFMMVALGVCPDMRPCSTTTRSWAIWRRCSTSSHMPCSRLASSSVLAASSMQYTPMKWRSWADSASTCRSRTSPSSSAAWPSLVYRSSRASAPRTRLSRLASSTAPGWDGL